MSYEIFENYKNEDFFIIDSNNRKESYQIQRDIFNFDYSWPSSRHFLIDEDRIYLCCYPYNKSLAYMNKRWSSREELEKEKNKALFYVKAEDFIENPEKYMAEV